jgi:hypothetical protein
MKAVSRDNSVYIPFGKDGKLHICTGDKRVAGRVNAVIAELSGTMQFPKIADLVAEIKSRVQTQKSLDMNAQAKERG